MASKKMIFIFISISVLFWLTVNYFVPILITVDVIANKFIYFAIKNFAYTFPISFLAAFLFSQMQFLKVAALLFLPIVALPLMFSILTFYVFINASTKTLRDLVVGSVVEYLIYWVVACGIFWVFQRYLRRKSEIAF